MPQCWSSSSTLKKHYGLHSHHSYFQQSYGTRTLSKSFSPTSDQIRYRWPKFGPCTHATRLSWFQDIKQWCGAKILTSVYISTSPWNSSSSHSPLRLYRLVSFRLLFQVNHQLHSHAVSISEADLKFSSIPPSVYQPCHWWFHQCCFRTCKRFFPAAMHREKYSSRHERS